MNTEGIMERTRDINRCQGFISKYIKKMREENIAMMRK